MSHTKGEWKYAIRTSSSKFYYELPYIYSDEEGDICESSLITHHSHRKVSKDEAEEAVANAKLIAAAPDLLDAFKHQLTLMNSMKDDVPIFMKGSKVQLEQAINKATEKQIGKIPSMVGASTT